ncbi:MAG: hypothetical protein ACYTDT_01570 [Planctomycetota bacterium]|jgi:hypothetical protein
MIRFQYDPDPSLGIPYGHFTIEGDNTRGYVMLAWNDEKAADEGFSGAGETMIQAWFETIGEAMYHCIEEYSILRKEWNAPSSGPQISSFESTRQNRRKGDSNVLNPDNVGKSHL